MQELKPNQIWYFAKAQLYLMIRWIDHSGALRCYELQRYLKGWTKSGVCTSGGDFFHQQGELVEFYDGRYPY